MVIKIFIIGHLLLTFGWPMLETARDMARKKAAQATQSRTSSNAGVQ